MSSPALRAPITASQSACPNQVNLVQFSSEHLRVNGSLPFDVVDATGSLIMPKGSVIASEDQLRQLMAHRLFVNYEQTEEWRRGLAGKIDQMVRQNVALKSIAQARPDDAHPLTRPPAQLPLYAELSDVQMRTALLLRDARPDAAWLQRVTALAQRTRQMAQREPDALLYLLTQATTHGLDQYSSHHALLCAVTVQLCANTLRWPERDVGALVYAALTMNVSMTALQDALAQQDTPPTPQQRLQIDEHPGESVRLLRDAGVSDSLWLDAVGMHHKDADPEVPLAQLPDAERLARLLRRVDVFTAKISPRKGRQGLPATLAARDACLGANGQPDEVGSAVIKTLGIYPPGSYVKLANGEVAVVLRRGLRANQPKAASIVRADGQPLGEPAPRNTAEPRYEVKASVRVHEVRVRLNAERMLALV
jgi:hypothetical protein